MGPDFTEEQKRYLEGFFAGLLTRRGAGTGPPPPAPGANGAATIAPAEPAASGPEAIHRAAQDRFLAAGKKLTAEEMAKRAKNPLDMWEEIRANAEAGRFPKGTDVFLHKFHGLFYVAPAQDAFMCRLRIPNGILGAHQLRGIAEIAERYAGGYADVTTRANLQLREIGPKSILDVLTAVQDLGLTTRGAGADNLRNITGSPTAGIDPDELIDTRPLCRELHYTILNHRELYGLPRKFNIGFDGGGSVSVLEDTNDIGFAAVTVGEGEAVAPGVYFRVLLGGITGHGDFGRDTGLLIKPEQCTPVALALVRGFIDHAHLGVHPQRQAGLFYLGVAVPVGRLTAEQMRSLANIAERHASGTLRLTVWQNLLISDVPAAEIAAAEAAVQALGLDLRAGPIRSGLVACTGNTGCKFALTNTKGQALELAEQLEAKVALDRPLNVHLTGCPNSCAQHYLADIGLLGTKVEAGDDMIEGYDVFIGGGAGTEQRLGRPLFRAVPFPELAVKLERVLRTYLGHRRSSEESFRAFSERHSVEELTQLLDAAA